MRPTAMHQEKQKKTFLFQIAARAKMADQKGSFCVSLIFSERNSCRIVLSLSFLFYFFGFLKLEYVWLCLSLISLKLFSTVHLVYFCLSESQHVVRQILLKVPTPNRLSKEPISGNGISARQKSILSCQEDKDKPTSIQKEFLLGC